MKIFVAKKRTIIFIGLSFFCFISLIAFITFIAPYAAKENLCPLVIIDPGHGGEDGGAVGHDGIVEKEINLKIALCLRDILQFSGYETVMTRDKDKAIYDNSAIKLRQKKVSDLRNRLAILRKNSSADSIFVSIHQNKFPNEKYFGTQIFYSEGNPLSEDLAIKVRENIIEQIQPKNTREIKRATSKIFLLNNSEIPSITTECGFLSNPEEAKKLSDETYQSKIAMCIFLGINDFFTAN
ncbi:MAG: N-acetylmuramoyl-L-alanine amidase [Firmicutes bacterium]|nr:N-acetylmuramoyl-L-alanine amidase [Bacillota bacterium]